MAIADLVTLIARYWYIPVIIALVAALKISRLEVAAGKGKVATANAEIKTQNANFASLESKVEQQNSEVQGLHAQLEAKQTEILDLNTKFAKENADVKAETRTLINSIDASKSCLQAQQDAIKFYKSRSR